jgi:hypothetical protein
MTAAPRIRGARTIATVVLAGVACTQPQPPLQPVQPALSERTSLTSLGSEVHDTRSKTGPADTVPPRPAEPPAELVELAAATRALEDSNSLDHHGIVVALRALADALALVAPKRTDLVSSIRSTADRLERSPKSSLEHADLVRIALDAARTIVAQGEPYSRWQMGPYARAVTAFTEAESSIDPDRPLAEQHAQVVTAFDGAVSVVELAAGVDVPRG